MARTPQLLDRWGKPVVRAQLGRELAAPTIGGVRSPISGYPGDGLDPVRLAQILESADQGDVTRYLELAETIEERDPHYLGVLATRKRSVSQIDVTVEAASDDARDVEMADMIRDWLKRDELADELFGILDCIGKGYSVTEILWETTEAQYFPRRLIRRDPRWFRFARHDMETPLRVGDNGEELPLDGFRFIFASIQAKSGLVIRSGLARVAAWGWMFKAYTQRDWAIFSQTYGQPLRVGKWGPNASESDKDTLFRAVVGIAGDCAAIIPESMQIEFVEAKNVGAASDLYEKRSDWLDKQISKAVLGQTATTDAVTGGLGSGKEHRQVQEDIERADARALAGILNRDLVRPWIDLEYGTQKRYPRIVIARPEEEDLKLAAESLGVLVPLGLRVSMSEVRDKFGWSDPKPDDEILVPETAAAAPITAPAQIAPSPLDRTSPIKRFSAVFKRQEPHPGGTGALQAEEPSVARAEAVSEPLVDRLSIEGAPAVDAMLARLTEMVSAAGSFDELLEMIQAGYGEVDASALAAVLGQAMTIAQAAGRLEVADGDNGV